MFVGEAIFGVALLVIGHYRRQLAALLRNNAAALLTINGSNELINLGGALGNRYALMLAPLSLVQAIGSTTTLFVFAIGIVLSVFFPRRRPRDLVASRAGAERHCGSLRRGRRRAGRALTSRGFYAGRTLRKTSAGAAAQTATSGVLAAVGFDAAGCLAFAEESRRIARGPQ